jgi:hypothetical protein
MFFSDYNVQNYPFRGYDRVDDRVYRKLTAKTPSTTHCNCTDMLKKALTKAIFKVLFTIAFIGYELIQCCFIEHFVIHSYGSTFVDGVLKFFDESGLLPGPVSKYYIHFFERSDHRFSSTILDMAKNDKSQSQRVSDPCNTPTIPYFPVLFRRLICYHCALTCKNVTIFCFPGRIPWWAYLRCLELPVLVNLNTKVQRIDFRGPSGELIAVWERGSNSKWFISWRHDIANTQECMDTSNLLRDVQGRKPLPLFTRGWPALPTQRGYVDPESAQSAQRAPWISETGEDAMTKAFHEFCERSRGTARA